MHLPRYKDWMEGTSRGLLKPRSKELKAIDSALLGFEKANSPYATEWAANEVRVALEAWKKAKGANWSTNERNKSGLITALDTELPRIKPATIGTGTGMEGETAQQLRHGVLFFLAKASTSAAPTTLKGFIDDGTDMASDVQGFVKTAGVAQFNIVGSDFMGKDGKRNGFLGDLSAKLIEYIKSLGSGFASFVSAFGYDLAKAAKDAAAVIIQGVPGLLLQILGGVVAKISALKALGEGLYQAGKAGLAVYQTRDCSAGILKGAPKEVIDSVRDQIKNHGYDGLKSALKAGVLTAISAIPGIGDIAGVIANAIASVYTFVTKVYDHLRDKFHLEAVITQAKAMIKEKSFTKPAVFNAWFRETIAHLPIISSYCMAMPMTGSYYGFLTLVTADGSQMSMKELDRNYAMFNDVKKWAKDFVKDYSVKLYSDDVLVKHSIGVARSEASTWENAKSGLGDRLKKITMGVMETAVS